MKYLFIKELMSKDTPMYDTLLEAWLHYDNNKALLVRHGSDITVCDVRGLMKEFIKRQLRKDPDLHLLAKYKCNELILSWLTIATPAKSKALYTIEQLAIQYMLDKITKIETTCEKTILLLMKFKLLLSMKDTHLIMMEYIRVTGFNKLNTELTTFLTAEL